MGGTTSTPPNPTDITNKTSHENHNWTCWYFSKCFSFWITLRRPNHCSQFTGSIAVDIRDTQTVSSAQDEIGADSMNQHPKNTLSLPCEKTKGGKRCIIHGQRPNLQTKNKPAVLYPTHLADIPQEHTIPPAQQHKDFFPGQEPRRQPCGAG